MKIHSAFGALMVSELLLNSGLMIGNLTLPWWISHSGGVGDLIIVGVSLAACAFLTACLLGPLSDRYPKKNVLLTGVLLYFFGSFGLAFFASYSGYQLPYLLLFSTLITVSTTLLQPCISSLIPELLPTDKIHLGIAIQKYVESFARVAAPAMGGMLLVWASESAAFWAQFTMACLSIAVLTMFFNPTRRLKQHIESSFFQDLLQGVKVSWSVPVEKYWTLVNFSVAICLIPTITLLLPLKIQSVRLDALWFGACEIAFAIGTFIGIALASIKFINRCARMWLLVLSGVIQGGVIMIPGVTQSGILLLCVFFLYGIFSNFFIMVGVTHRLLARPESFRGRMSSVAMVTMQIANMLSPLIAGILILYVSIDMAYLIFGLLAVLLCLLYFLIPGLKKLLNIPILQVNNWYERQYPHVFTSIKSVDSRR